MTIIRVGATKKYSDGWESAFGKGKKSAAVAVKSSSMKSAKTSAKKKTAKKKKGKK